MLLYNAALLCLLAKFTSAGYYIIYSGSGGSGSPGSGGASDPLRYFPEDCDNYAEFTNIVRNETGPVLLDDDDYSIRGNENNTGVIDMPCKHIMPERNTTMSKLT